MPVLRLFAAAREAAGEARVEVEGRTVGDVLDEARARYGEGFAAVLQRSRVWLNGQPADPAAALSPHDVVAVLPPVSGGAGAAAATAAAAPPAPPPTAAPGPEPSLAPSEPPPGGLEPAPPGPAPAVEATGPAVPVPSLEDEAAPLVADPLSPIAPTPSPELAAEQRMTDPWGPWPQQGDLGRYPTPPDLAPAPPAEPPVEEAPSRFQSSTDDLLDRLAGLAPFSGDPLFGEAEDETGGEDRVAPLPAEPDLDPDLAGWGPASGPVWSLGTNQPPPPPPPAAEAEPEPDLWKWPDPPPSPPSAPASSGQSGPEGPAESSSPFAPPPPSDWDRRWDAPLLDDPEEGRGEGDARRSSLPPIRPPRQETDSDEPAVRILGPADGEGPPPAPVHMFDQPAVRILGGEKAGRVSGGSKPSTLVVEAPAEGQEGPVNGAGKGGETAAVRSEAPSALAPERGSVAAPAPAPTPAPAPQPEKVRRKPPPLAVVITANRPHGRLGLLWVAITVGAVVAGSMAAAVWLAACATVSAIQTSKVWQDRNEKPLLPLAAAIAAVLPLSAIWGLRAMTAVVAAAVVLALLARLFSVTKAPARDVGLTLAIGIVVGLAAASVVLLRNIDIHAPLLLLAFAAAYDAGAYLVGTGASSAWEGPAAGVAALIPVTMLSAVVLVPPFRAGGPLILGLIAAVLAPCGPLAGSALLGERDANAPALRRLDSLLVLGPVWAWCAAALLR